jgi:HlyD family secretion protein
LSVDGTIEVDRLEDVLHVGRPGYVQPESQSRVWKLEPDGATAAAVPVRFGLASLNTIEVVDGLAVGDRIIVSDMSRWSDVDRVRIR